MKKLYQIDEFFDEVDESFALAAESPLDEQTYEIVSDDDFFDAVQFHYGERSIYIPETDTPKVTFKRMWDAFVRQRGSQFAAAFGALLTAYNPLENYSMEEKHTGDDKTVKTPTNWKTVQTPTGWKEVLRPLNWQEAVTQTPTNWKTTLTKSASQDYKETESEKPTNWEKEVKRETGADNEVSESNTIYAFNSSSPVPTSGRTTQTKEDVVETQSGQYDREKTFAGNLVDETAQTGTYETVKAQSGTYETEQVGTMATEQQGTFEDKTTYNTTLRRSGNVGVTTSQQMALSEVQLRMTDLVGMILAEFFNKYSIYV